MKKKTGLIKIRILSLVSGLAFCLTGCMAVPSEKYAIAGTDWQIGTVQSMQEEGRVIACGKEQAELYDGAAVVEITCTADSGNMQIHDLTNGRKYVLTYDLTDADAASAIYRIRYDEQQGIASVSRTTVWNEDAVRTLVIRMDDQILTLYDRKTPPL